MSLVQIIGDVHLGASFSIGKPHPDLYANSRLIDYEDTLITTINDGAEAGCKFLVFTGDIFEHRLPSLTQQKVFSKALCHAINQGFEDIHIVIGNHDMTRVQGVNSLGYLQELNLPNIHIHDEITTVVLQDGGKPVCNLITLPYRDRKFYSTDSYNEAIEYVRKAVQYQVAGITNKLPRLLVGHFAIEGTLFDDEFLDIYGENQLFLPKTVFDGIDLTLMGHIHQPEIVSEQPYIAYVGSMEKRSGSEEHDKVYAIVDTEKLMISGSSPENALEYKVEPCRKIYDIKLDYSQMTLGELLPGHIVSDIDDFGAQHEMREAIVKIGLKISGADDKYVQLKQLYKHLKEKWKIHHCVDIKPEIFSARQARNDKITEQVSDVEAFRLFLDTAVDDVELRKEVFSSGSEIIKIVEIEYAAS